MATQRAPIATRSTQTGKLITAAARTVFLAEGYEAASMDAIARQADVSKATLYAHFASKESLFIAVMLGLSEEFAAQLDQIASDRSGTLEQQLTRAGISLLDCFLSEAKLRMFRVIIAETGRIPQVCQNFIRTTRANSYRRIAEIFAGHADASHLAPGDCDRAAKLFIATLRGDLLWSCLIDAQLSPSSQERKASVAAIAKLFTNFPPSDGIPGST